MKEKNILVEKSKEFAIEIIKFYSSFEKYFSPLNQLLRSATSIGANIAEAQYAQSKLDFVSKLEIALKECNETKYWLEILTDADIIEKNISSKFKKSAGFLQSLLIKSCKTAKSNLDEPLGDIS